MPQHVKINGAWKQISSEYVKSNSTWKTVGQKWVNVSGVWKQVFQKTISAPSTFTSLSNSISYSGSEFLNANDNLYMANGSTGKVYRFDSNATNSWVQISGSNGPLSGYPSYFVFANGTFYLGSTNGGYKSTDLVTWTSWTGIPSNMYRLIHTGSRFFCLR